MRRFLPYILIVFTLVNFLAPVSIGLSEKNRVVVEKNVARADADKYKTAFPNSSISQDASNYIDETTAGVDLSIKIDTGIPEGTSSANNWAHVQPKFSLSATNFLDEKEFIVVFTEKTTNKTGWIDFTKQITIVDGVNYGDKLGNSGMYNGATIKPYIKSMTPIGDNGISQFKPDTEYEANFYYLSCNTRIGCIDDGNDSGGDKIVGFDESGNYFKIATGPIKTASKTQIVTGAPNQTGSTVTPGQNADTMPVCIEIVARVIPVPQVGGCFAQLIYYALFVPTSYIFALAGNFFDWTFAYSVNDASYRSGFVVQGWGVVRDFCNMFFIFILLYVAFTTILGTSGAKTKEMIVNVVIIGLLINFSLFATQIIIDASNILARVFYNSNTIVITPNGSTVGQTGLGTTPSDPTGTGIIPLSEALVNKINPQNLIINAKDVNDLSTQSNIGVAKNASNDDSISVGRFIIVTLLATGVNIVGFVVFLSVALIFVGRVVMLWIAMILSPIVFFTYMVPAMQNFDTIGWKKWWPETLKLAFLAPVFIFFLYIILKFLQTDLVFIDSTGKHGIQMVIAVMVPFAFIMVLLLQAKKIATSMAGKMGETMAKAGSAVSGLALGAATGGAALAMRGTIGAAGSAMKNSKWAQNMAGSKNKFTSFIGNKSMDVGGKIGSKAFDVRNTSLGKSAAKSMGVESDIGKASEGGFDGAKKRQMEKAQKRAKELEPNQNSKEKKDLNVAQEALKDLENKHNRDVEPQQAKVDTAQQNWNMANSEYMADKTDPIKKQNLDAAKIKLDEEKDEMFAIKNGGLDPATGKYRTTNGNISQKAIDKANTDFGAADRERTSANTSQGNANTALIDALRAMERALDKVTDAEDNLAQAKIATKDAADYATLHPQDTAAAISHTNALTIQAAAQAEMDKVNTEVKTTTTAHATATITKDDADSRVTAAGIKYTKADTARGDADTARITALANGGVGESINEIKSGSLKAAQNAYDIKSNANKNNFAGNTQYTGSNVVSKIFNYTVNGGVYSGAGADEAAHNIRMDVKT